jgi:hypothetical protein
MHEINRLRDELLKSRLALKYLGMMLRYDAPSACWIMSANHLVQDPEIRRLIASALRKPVASHGIDSQGRSYPPTEAGT